MRAAILLCSLFLSGVAVCDSAIPSTSAMPALAGASNADEPFRPLALWGKPELLAPGGSDPAFAVDEAGILLAAWREDGDVRARSFSAGVLSVAVRISDGGKSHSPAVAYAGGVGQVAWLQAEGGVDRVRVRDYVAARGWGPVVALSRHDEHEPAPASQLRIAADASGRAMAMWVQAREVGSVPEIWSAEHVHGRGWAAVERFGGPWAETPHVVMDGNGNAVAAWTSESVAYNSVRVREHHAGHGWGPVFSPWGRLDAADRTPCVALNRDGAALAVWSHVRCCALGSDIYASHHGAMAWSQPARIEWDEVAHSRAPQAGLDAQGNALVVWQQGEEGAGEIWMARYRAGEGWRAAQRLQPGSGDAAAPQLVVHGNGDAWVLWSERRADGEHLVLARLRSDKWTLDELPVSEASHARVGAGGGEVFVVWQQADGVWFARALSDN